MRKTRVLVTLLCLWLGLMPLAAQSVKIINELELNPFASALALYKNEFGSFENHALDIPFPYAVIRMHLEGSGPAVREAKERLTLDVGQMFRVESRVTTYSNQIVFLVKAKRLYMLIDCGDGCEKVLLSNMQQLGSNCVYDCTVQYRSVADEQPVALVDAESFKQELLNELAGMLKKQEETQPQIEEPVQQDTIVEPIQPVQPVEKVEESKPNLKDINIRTMVLGQLGYSLAPQLSYGLMFAQTYGPYGWYINGRSNFNFTKPSDGLSCTEGGWIGDELPFYKSSAASVWHVNAGFVCDVLAIALKPENKFHSVGLYMGAGYGKYERLWQMSDNRWVRYAPTFTSGVSVNAGVIGSFYGVTLMVGVNTINFNYMEIEVGLGYMF